MKTFVYRVTGQGDEMEEALKATEKIGADSGLNKKEILRLRLLAEELFGMMQSIAGDVEARYWVESSGTSFAIRMEADINMSKSTRKRLLSASTDGGNAAAKGFMGKIRDMITEMTLPREIQPKKSDSPIIRLGDESGNYRSDDRELDWSMKKYKNEIRQENVSRAQDELEKSIVANIADDVSISIIRSHVSITILKDF